jgi:hypothetical protein
MVALILLSPNIQSWIANDIYALDYFSETSNDLLNSLSLTLICTNIGAILFIVGISSMTDLDLLKRMCFLLFIMISFFALPQFIDMVLGNPTSPLVLLMLNFMSPCLLFYGYKKGIV